MAVDDFTGKRLGRDENSPAEQLGAALTVIDQVGPGDGELTEENRALLANLLDILGIVEPVAVMRGILRESTEAAKARRRLLPVPSPMCGSAPGAQVHHRNDEPLCWVCQAWSDERHRLTRTAAGSRCGSPAGAQMHRQLGEKICPRCVKRKPAKPEPELLTLTLEATAQKMTLTELGQFIVEAMTAGATGAEVLWVRTARHKGGSAIHRADIKIDTGQVAPADTPNDAPVDAGPAAELVGAKEN